MPYTADVSTSNMFHVLPSELRYSQARASHGGSSCQHHQSSTVICSITQHSTSISSYQCVCMLLLTLLTSFHQVSQYCHLSSSTLSSQLTFDPIHIHVDETFGKGNKTLIPYWSYTILLGAERIRHCLRLPSRLALSRLRSCHSTYFDLNILPVHSHNTYNNMDARIVTQDLRTFTQHIQQHGRQNCHQGSGHWRIDRRPSLGVQVRLQRGSGHRHLAGVPYDSRGQGPVKRFPSGILATN